MLLVNDHSFEADVRLAIKSGSRVIMQFLLKRLPAAC